MPKATDDASADEARPHYDFDRLEGLGRGAHLDPAARDGTVVRLDPDLVNAFPSSEAVNAALRSLVAGEERVAGRPVPAEHAV